MYTVFIISLLKNIWLANQNPNLQRSDAFARYSKTNIFFQIFILHLNHKLISIHPHWRRSWSTNITNLHFVNMYNYKQSFVLLVLFYIGAALLLVGLIFLKYQEFADWNNVEEKIILIWETSPINSNENDLTKLWKTFLFNLIRKQRLSVQCSTYWNCCFLIIRFIFTPRWPLCSTWRNCLTINDTSCTKSLPVVFSRERWFYKQSIFLFIRRFIAYWTGWFWMTCW